MRDVALRRIQPDKNMARFYAIDIQPTLCSATGRSCGGGDGSAAHGRSSARPGSPPPPLPSPLRGST